jgi:hypothetical protein
VLFGLAVYKPRQNPSTTRRFATLIAGLLGAMITALRAVKRIALGVKEKLRVAFR